MACNARANRTDLMQNPSVGNQGSMHAGNAERLLILVTLRGKLPVRQTSILAAPKINI